MCGYVREAFEHETSWSARSGPCLGLFLMSSPTIAIWVCLVLWHTGTE